MCVLMCILMCVLMCVPMCRIGNGCDIKSLSVGLAFRWSLRKTTRSLSGHRPRLAHSSILGRWPVKTSLCHLSLPCIITPRPLNTSFTHSFGFDFHPSIPVIPSLAGSCCLLKILHGHFLRYGLPTVDNLPSLTLLLQPGESQDNARARSSLPLCGVPRGRHSRFANCR